MATAVYERRDVWTLSDEDDWHPVIRWYERGVSTLQAITDLSNSRSWEHLANIHGTFTPRQKWPRGIGDRGWNACQHRSWFFLPWHRIYLHHFERILRDVIIDQGGPRDWALPFWNYDPNRPTTLSLPPAFLSQKLPSHGGASATDNALFVARRLSTVNAGQPIDPDDVGTTGWVARFTAASPAVTTFGGPKTGWAHNGPGLGQLELEPHGLIHVDVGGSDGSRETGGFMSFFELAARDPIFWLHHANIDRLWEVWRNQAGHHNTKDPKWLNARFDFGNGNWATSMKVEEVIDTTASPLNYRYEGVDVPAVVSRVRAITDVPAERVEPSSEVGMGEDVVPELTAASETKIPVSGPKTVRAKRTKPRGPAAGERRRLTPANERVYLVLENVIAKELGAGRYVVHVNVPEGDDPRDHKDLRAGKISTFGLDPTTQSDDEGQTSGATFSFDITHIVSRLEAMGDWDKDDVRVTITPQGKDPHATIGALEVGRVAVYYE